MTEKSRETCALQDSGSTGSLIDKSPRESLKLDTKDCKRVLTGTKSSRSITEGVTVKVSTKSLKPPENINCLFHLNLSVGSLNYNYSADKRKFPHLSILLNQKTSHSEVKLIIGQDMFTMVRPIEYRSLDKRNPWGVSTPFGCH